MDNNKKFELFRKRVPVLEKWAYLETASTGLIPDFVYDGVNRYHKERFLKGGDSTWIFEDENVGTLGMMDRSKEALSKLINCDKDEIAFGQSSTQMFTMVTEGINYSENDNVVTVDYGWIGNRFAWQKKEMQGLEVRYVNPVEGKISVSDIIAKCDEDTRAVTVNLVESNTGFLMDIDELGEFCEKSNILLFVDAVQAVGALKVNVKKSKIDFLVGNDYKWMMNFCGTGYAYISPKVSELITNWGSGWMSDSDRFNTKKRRLELRADAGRFEIGYPQADGIYGMGLVAANNVNMGLDDIDEYVRNLAEYFRTNVAKLKEVRNSYDFDYENRCQVSSIKFSHDSKVTNEGLEKANIFAHVGCEDERKEREMRVSFHYYNNKEDVDRLLNYIEVAK